MRNIGHAPVVWSGPGGVGTAGCVTSRVPVSDTGGGGGAGRHTLGLPAWRLSAQY